ncbi:patatin-like phospholipase domain-containing protein 2 [Cynoglossus semilaevis]|uniref:patatin-like phospholipase domain-containing protein 2 n=1 Tax=Cynoglossus semilaevis TaxID=244447 RepID=UPI000496C097|nr:patatin-like phospholipase domain-containing protein 2 [Cynoglossus semilaevis]
MEPSERMFCWEQEWNISFAGCGFRSIYHIGAMSCVQERAPRLIQGASKICGASSGCLVAVALTVGIPVEQFCADVLKMAGEARSHRLGVFHPTFSLLRRVHDSLLERLPEDAHLKASGKLCVSLTRVADGKNVLVSEFDSRDELIQVLTCSCFFPVYCGFTPPSYRGVLYMDGALSNNMPLFEQRNTITVAPFSGESDICPREGTFNFFEVHYGNVSIQVNTGNVHRICTSFLPTTLQKLAEICRNGYMDALRFLRENDLLGTERIPSSLVAHTRTLRPECCAQVKDVYRARGSKNGMKSEEEKEPWLDHRTMENLPPGIQKVLFETCRDSPDRPCCSALTDLLPIKVLSCIVTILTLPVKLTFSLTNSVIQLAGTVIHTLLTSSKHVCSGGKNNHRDFSEQQLSSQSSGADHCHQTVDRHAIQPLTSSSDSTSNVNLHWDDNRNLDLVSLSSMSSGRPTLQISHLSKCGKMALNQRTRGTHRS